jgi:hypothetical protein
VISAMRVVFVERDIESSASQLPAQRSDEHALTRSRVAGDDATVEVISAQLGGGTPCDGVQHPLEIQRGAHPTRRRAADANHRLHGLARPDVVTNIADDLARETAVGQTRVEQEQPGGRAAQPAKRRLVSSISRHAVPLVHPPQARCSGHGIWTMPTPARCSLATTSSTTPGRVAPP